MSQQQSFESSQSVALVEDDLFPEEWEIGRLRNVAEIFPSNIDKKFRDNEVNIRLCNYTEVYNNDEIDESLEFMESTAKPSRVNRFRLRKGDVIITKDSESRDEIGIPARVVRDFDDVVCGYHLFLIRPNRSRINPEFLFWVLDSKLLASQFEQSANGVTRYGLTTLSASNTTIPIPPKEYQETVVSLLDCHTARIDALVSKQKRLLDLLAEKRQAFIKQAVTKGLDSTVATKNTGVEWLDGIPEHWNTTRTRFVARLESGHTPSKSNDEYWTDTDIPWVSLADSGRLRENDHITETERYTNQRGLNNSSAHLLPTETVVFTRDATVGLCAILDRPMAVAQHLVGWVCGPKILPEYLLNVFKSMGQELDLLTRGSTISTIGMPDIRSLNTPLPPIKEQREIVEHIQSETEQLWNLIDDVERSIDLLKEKRQALITAAVTGQIDVTEDRGEIQEGSV